MKQTFKKLIKPLIPKATLLKRREKFNSKEIENWKNEGSPVPPPHAVKQKTIEDYGRKYNCSVLVETGTFRGDMVEAQKFNFDQLFSIELSTTLYNDAVKRFNGDANVSILQGDSGDVLPKLIPKLNEVTLFWLDGHYSSGVTAKGEKNCPIYKEIDAIFEKSELNHILLIDDARDFNGTEDYPTLEELKSYINNKNSTYSFEVEHDLIRCVPS
jgi:hypothetical protein